MKLYTLWHSLSPRIKQGLKQWLASPYHNTREDVRLLYAHLRKYDETAISLEKTVVFAALYGNAVYNDNWLRHAQSFLLKAMEDYLAYQTMEESSAQKLFFLAKAYNNLQLEKPFQQTFQAIQTALKTTPLHDANSLQLQNDIEKLWFQNEAQKSRKAEKNLQIILVSQEKAFAADKLRTVCTAMSYQNLYQLDYDFGVLDAILSRIEAQSWHKTEPAIAVYYFIYKMNAIEDGFIFFDDLRAEMTQNIQSFEKYEQRNIFIFAINYTIKQCNKGNQTFFRKLFDLYKEGIESHILIDNNGELSPYTYKNMVATGLRIGEIDYAFHFLETYKDKMPIENRKNFYEYNLARYYFTIKHFTQALPLLEKLTYGDIFFQLDAKVMLLKLYYQLDDYDKLDLTLQNFQQFLHRKKELLSYHQQNYLNIIYCFKQLITYDTLDKAAVLSLKTEISTLNPLTEREWLLSNVKPV